MVHQHFKLVQKLTVAENNILGQRPAHRSIRDMSAHHRRIHEVSDRDGLDGRPGTLIENLTVGEQQRVEILKALYQAIDHPDPRRADRSPHTARDRPAACTDARPRARRQDHHLHHPQTERGHRGQPAPGRTPMRPGSQVGGGFGATCCRSRATPSRRPRARRPGSHRPRRPPAPAMTAWTCRCTPARSTSQSQLASAARRGPVRHAPGARWRGARRHPISTGVSLHDVNQLGIAHVPRTARSTLRRVVSVASNLVLERFDEAPCNGFIRDFRASRPTPSSWSSASTSRRATSTTRDGRAVRGDGEGHRGPRADPAPSSSSPPSRRMASTSAR